MILLQREIRDTDGFQIKSKEELILWLLEINNDFEIFKSISFFSNSESWSNSRIPLIENKIKFLEDLKSKILVKSDIKYISHINHINSTILKQL